MPVMPWNWNNSWFFCPIITPKLFQHNSRTPKWQLLLNAEWTVKKISLCFTTYLWLLDPLKLFQNNFNVWWFSCYHHQSFPYTFCYGKAIKVHWLLWLCTEPVVCQTARVYFYLDTVIINYLIRWIMLTLEKINGLICFSYFFRIQFNAYIYC